MSRQKRDEEVETTDAETSAPAPAERTVEPLDLTHVVALASAILASSSVSHRDTNEVTRLAVQQLRSLMTAVDAENA